MVRVFILCCFVLRLSFISQGQDISVLPELKSKLLQSTGEERLSILEELAFNQTHPDSILYYSELLIEESQTFGSYNYQKIGYTYVGDAYMLKGDYDLSFKSYFESLKLIEKHRLSKNDIDCHIADTYSLVGDQSNALKYYRLCINELKDHKDPLVFGSALFNLGDTYLQYGQADSAKYYNEKARKIFEEEGDDFFQIYADGNAGLIAAELNDYKTAEKKLDRAIESFHDFQIYDAVAEYQLGMAKVFMKKEENGLALEYATKALEEAHTGENKELIKESSLLLSDIYEKLNKTGEAFSFLKQYLAYRDSINYGSVVKKMSEVKNAYEAQLQEKKSRQVGIKEAEFLIDAPEFYAVLIGVNDYVFNDDVISDLNEPIENTESLYASLTTEYQFEESKTIKIHNATRADIINTFEMLSKTMTEKDNLLVFYAGHGTYDDKLSIGYWLPADAKSDSKANWISNSVIRDYVAGLPSRHTLLISDACFSGSIFKTRSLGNNLDDYAISRIYKLTSRKAMTSGTLEIVPDESVFIKYLIKSLNENEQEYVTAKQLFNSIEPSVLNNTQNTPQYGIMQNSGDEGGEFIFIRSK